MRDLVDLNVDMGESYGRWSLGEDAEVMPSITSANVACGVHAGDAPGAAATARAVRRALEAAGVTVSRRAIG